jgi:hypothetical protein
LPETARDARQLIEGEMTLAFDLAIHVAEEYHPLGKWASRPN